ncbi:TonB-dependent receptor [Shewanella baltica]|uniref:TonB-dependent receptor n=1 Tax=Shewanella baltica TaxID=62322 RepID=UPI0021681228|nr:TonB-dependent receptor [Shewanella baltica]MCS6115018.1 TonB-dependent receptor [Shewanella baltica]UVW63289.1 TonB-dependent receptor [Shewanella baltica]
MTNLHFKLNTLAISLAVAGLCTGVVAAEAPNVQVAKTQEPKKAKEYIEQIVVTGTASGKSMKKVDASYAITTIDAESIERLAPKSTADLFKAVPGVWAESSGGVSGANVFVRGFPGGGDAPFLTVQLQDVPVYQPSTLSFLENSSLFRIDETVQFMDALRGGPSSVVSAGQPGLTTNFILKEGSDATEGRFKYSTSDYGLQRVDAVVSGSLAEDLYFMAGGYAQESSGIRDAGFNSEKGQQFTVNITKVLDNGKLNLFTRVTDDHGAWYLPTPLVAGVDNSYTQVGPLNRQATIEFGPNGESKAIDIGDGRGWKGAISGGSLDLDFDGGWSLVDRFAYTSGDANTLGLVPNGSPVALSTVADNGVSAIGAVSQKTYGGDTLVQQLGRWVVLKNIEALTNDLAMTKKSDSYQATLGLYRSDYSVKDWWSIGNQAYYLVQAGGEALTGIDCNDNKDSCDWNYDINAVGDGKTSAFYGAFEYIFSDQWSADIGLRNENHQIDYTVDEGLDGVINKSVDYDQTDLSWTAGINWQFSDNAGVFLRASEGSKMPSFDDFRDNYDAYTKGENLIKDVTQYELGYKLALDNLNLYATGFFNEVKGDTFVRKPGDPAEVLTNEAYGLELDAAYFNDSGFSINMNGTLQSTEITESPINKGNEAQRQPKWQIRLTPSYDFEVAGLDSTLYGTLSAVGDRYGNNENTVVLDGYEKLDIGLIVRTDGGLKFELGMQNVTDEDALTEGDPRSADAANGRYIMPRTTTFNVSYDF